MHPQHDTLGDLIAEQEQFRDHAIRTPIPPPCQQVWEVARQDASLHLGQLYALCEPLQPHVGGHWHHDSGDIAVVVTPNVGHTVARLLHELGHAVRRSPIPTTIAADWEEEVATWECALDLAHTWHLDTLVPTDWVQEQLAYTWQLLQWHEQAGELAGSAHPAVARRALSAMQELADHHGWTTEQFEDALYGLFPEAPDAPDAACFNRSRLRSGWRLSYGTEITFGSVACPLTILSKRLLRETLRTIAHVPPVGLTWTQRTGLRYQLLPPLDASTCDQVIGFLNTLFLDQPGAFPAGIWQVYGDAQARLYHLNWSYTSDLLDRAEVWVLAAPHHERDRAAEAAFQHYLSSWTTIPVRFDGPLALGMSIVFASLATLP